MKEEWRQRLADAASATREAAAELLLLMARKRVLALRHRLRTRAFTHVAELAHRSSTEAVQQVTLYNRTTCTRTF